MALSPRQGFLCELNVLCITNLCVLSENRLYLYGDYCNWWVAIHIALEFNNIIGVITSVTISWHEHKPCCLRSAAWHTVIWMVTAGGWHLSLMWLMQPDCLKKKKKIYFICNTKFNISDYSTLMGKASPSVFFCHINSPKRHSVCCHMALETGDICFLLKLNTACALLLPEV